MDRRMLAAMYARVVADGLFRLRRAARRRRRRRRPPRTLLRENPRHSVLVRPERLVRLLPRTPARLQGVSSRSTATARRSRRSRFRAVREWVSSRRTRGDAAHPPLGVRTRSRASHAGDGGRLCYARWRPRSRTPRTPTRAALPLEGRRARREEKRRTTRTPRGRLRRVSRRRLGRWNETRRNGHPRRGGGSNARGTRGEGHGRARRAMGARDRGHLSRRRVTSGRRFGRFALEDARDASAVRAPLRTANDDTPNGDDSDSKDVAVSDSKTSPFRVPKTSPSGSTIARGAIRVSEPPKAFGRVVVEQRGNRRDERGVLRRRRDSTPTKPSCSSTRSRARRARTSLGRRRRVLRRKRGGARARLASTRLRSRN